MGSVFFWFSYAYLLLMGMVVAEQMAFSFLCIENLSSTYGEDVSIGNWEPRGWTQFSKEVSDT